MKTCDVLVLTLLSLNFVNGQIAYFKINYNNTLGFYTIPLYFGGNNESFELQIDTTITESWIPSLKFPLDVKKYDISQSSTGEITKKSLEIEDEEGTIFGKACYDNIRIGKININHFGFGLANEVGYKFIDYPQGKLGLGYGKKNQDDFNIVKKLKMEGIINKEEFMINKAFNMLFIGNISMLFGNSRNTECKLVETKNLKRIYRSAWSCLLTSFFFFLNGHYVNGLLTSISYEFQVEVNFAVIFDSAFKYLTFPNNYLEVFSYYFIDGELFSKCKQFKDLDSIYYRCYDESLLLNAKIYFLIDNYVYELLGGDLFVETGEGEYELLIRFHKKDENVFCFGSPFMNKFSTSFDYEGKKIAFYGGPSFSYNDIMNIQKEIDNQAAIAFFKFIGKALIIISILAFFIWLDHKYCRFCS